MDITTTRIIFMGTPDFAVASLDQLVKAGLNIVGVVTAPDKPAGRGMQLQQSAVKKYAVENELHILQPEKLKAPEFIEELRSLEADLQVVVAFRMLPEIVWNMPPLGTINLHGSLLPQYRGAAPINWAVINGESYTGVTTFKLKHEIDTGNVLLSEKIAISPDETAGEVHDRLMLIGASLLVKTVKRLIEGTIAETPQTKMVEEELKHAPKIFTETCRIHWNQPVEKVYNLIRGLSPHPGAFTMIGDKTFKIFQARMVKEDHNNAPGKMETDHKSWLRFWCIGGYVEARDIQLQGKKRMPVGDFLRGFRF